MHSISLKEAKRLNVHRNLPWLSDIQSGRNALDLHSLLVKYPEAPLSQTMPLSSSGDDAEANSRERHDGKHAVKLAQHDFGSAYAGAKCLFFEYEEEASIPGVEDSLAFHASRHRLVDIAGQIEEFVPKLQDCSGVLGSVKQAREDGVLVSSKQLCTFVEGHGRRL